jgi:3-hydroxyisobutyrate dehydrogenase-like beta-hydroxyacid dehydrogenase
MTIGFIGLGNMGLAIAGRLLKAGEALIVWNRSPEPADQLASQGAHKAQDPVEVFAACDVVFSMLAEDKAVEAVVLASGALDKARPGLVHVNLATVSVALAERLTDEHRQLGLGYVAAPVLGRPDVAEAGELNVLVAGPQDSVDRVRPMIDRFAKAVWPFGETPAHANVVKLACNFGLGAAIEMLAEAGALAKSYGVEPEAVYELMTSTLFAAPAYKVYAGVIRERRFKPAGFPVPLGLKDVRLALQAAEARNLTMPLGSVVRDHLIEAMAQGRADQDWASLALVALRRAGLEEPA